MASLARFAEADERKRSDSEVDDFFIYFYLRKKKIDDRMFR